MKRKWLIIIASFLLLVLTAGGYLYYLYQKPRANVATIKASYSLTPQNLYDEFVSNEAAATLKYVNKIIEVRGKVIEVQKMDSTAMILLGTEDNTGGINCSFQNASDDLPGKGQIITVKGRCTGYLMDVNLVDAIVVK